MNANDLARGADEPVDLRQIERQLSELWRAEGESSEEGVTKAALWNVIAHTDNDSDRGRAQEELGMVSAAIPQRTIIIRADQKAQSELGAWISANCHLVGGEKQVCSEEISIVAGGERVHHVPSIVNALLLPDMPVAAWWIGDLPSEDQSYVTNLLEPADRLIVDSSHFDGADDLELLARIGSTTDTRPSDLNWARLEQWRVATASLFDAPQMRRRLLDLRAIRVMSSCTGSPGFGERVDAMLYAAWLRAILGPDIPVTFDSRDRPGSACMVEASLEFGSSERVRIERVEENRVIVARLEGSDDAWPTVTSYDEKNTTELIIRQLSRRDEDVLYPRALPIAASLAASL